MKFVAYLFSVYKISVLSQILIFSSPNTAFHTFCFVPSILCKIFASVACFTYHLFMNLIYSIGIIFILLNVGLLELSFTESVESNLHVSNCLRTDLICSSFYKIFCSS